ncbi:carboxypeptidase-like regulatory domain-containing protein [Thiocystis violacea]|uniref:carboxypeptidase-like regulatory domain-containing protein n=1 Tax=Thiocystis violacea TaxID=13725 RepID=UPI001F5B7487|nr:carboxypeptidase-like regulatory domain-containing protein [Thiocystis violacea]
MRLIHTDGALRLAEAQTTYGIRPADGASASPSSIPSSSVIKSEGGIPYVSGGVGESERSELKALASQFNLHLLFATQGSGEYLSAVRVNILDARRESVLTAESKGPWFYAQLPPGDYSLEVTPTGPRGQDETQRKDVHLGASGQSRVDFYWKK